LLNQILSGGPGRFLPFRRDLETVTIELGMKLSLDLGGMSVASN
jgi:hypothetical protein